mgnify:CR=1 FL=1
MESNSAAEVIDDAINDSKMPEFELPKESVFTSKDKERDARYYKYDKTGKLISDFAYAAADVLNDTYVKVEKKPYIGLYTKDQKEYLYEGIESITAPSQRVVFAKQNDLWGLMKLTE